MSLQLIFILVVLMTANQIIGTGYGSWKSGFDRGLFFRGVKKILLLFVGYGAIALAARFVADYMPKAEYLSGILLEPIAKYFTKVCDSLKQLLNEPTKTESSSIPQEPTKPDAAQEEPPPNST
ncbi:hypothetical protein [Oscillibacter sp. 1-3]|uniref:hypothetical protein n=1 Tax=Oscillibacter sp. 1-3 TaxID=1235797 RepID=UPI00033CE07E|nr:hypothetical protein [Oscillibacter sp. 1-3]EOS64972.1 hypothetical protein C816_02699 [Oscillibacter sp. 1-3]